MLFVCVCLLRLWSKSENRPRLDVNPPQSELQLANLFCSVLSVPASARLRTKSQPRGRRHRVACSVRSVGLGVLGRQISALTDCRWVRAEGDAGLRQCACWVLHGH